MNGTDIWYLFKCVGRTPGTAFDIVVINAGGPPPGDFRDWDRDAWLKAIDILGLSNGARSGLTGFVASVARNPTLAGHGVTLNNCCPASSTPTASRQP